VKAMRSNRGRTRPERMFASLLWRLGFRYVTPDGYRSVHGERFLGQPDLIFTRKRVVIFVDGCFWHGCPRCHNVEADCNEFWQHKIEGNRIRDRRVTKQLEREDWTVIRVWEHDLRSSRGRERVVRRVGKRLSKK